MPFIVRSLERYLYPYLRRIRAMKVKNSLKTWKTRDRNSKLVRRRGRVYIINKRNPRMKGRQG